jgi:hypothetical protein
VAGEDIVDFDSHAAVDLDSAGGDDGNGNGNGNGNSRRAVSRINTHNNSGRALYNTWLIAGDRAWLIGRVTAHGLTHFRVDTPGFDLSNRNDEWSDRLDRHPEAPAANMLLLRTLLTRKDATTTDATHSAYPGLGTALLVAGTSTSHPLLLTRASATWQHTARTLVLLPVPAALLVKDESAVTDLWNN